MFVYIVILFKSNLCSTYVLIIKIKTVKLTTNWSSGNAFASGTRGLKFESRAGETEHTVADG